MRRSPSLPLLLAIASSLLLACGDKKEKAWWEKSEACPEGAIERDGSAIFCAVGGVRHGRYENYAASGDIALVSGAYKNGLRDGAWTQRTAAGKVLGTSTLSAGNRVGEVWMTAIFEDGEFARTERSTAAQAELDAARKVLTEQARNAGILGVLSQDKAGHFASPDWGKVRRRGPWQVHHGKGAAESVSKADGRQYRDSEHAPDLCSRRHVGHGRLKIAAL